MLQTNAQILNKSERQVYSNFEYIPVNKYEDSNKNLFFNFELFLTIQKKKYAEVKMQVLPIYLNTIIT